MPVHSWPVEVHEVSGCWEWHGRRDRGGYGRKGLRLAHRVVYEAEVGDIPADYVVDHRCRNRRCVRPEHLEAVTRIENERRKSRRYRYRKLLKCQRGHLLRLHGRRTPQNGEICRTCCGL